MVKVTKDNAPIIFAEAQREAAEATQKYLNEYGDGWPCGFAWVVIKPARGAFVSYLKSIEEGSKHYYGGWSVWNPSKNFTQNMDAKMAGARAFANVLQKYGINAYAQERMD